MKKKIIGFLALIFAFCFILSGCGSDSPAVSENSTPEAFSENTGSEEDSTEVSSYSYEYSSGDLYDYSSDIEWGDDDSDVLYIYEDEQYSSKDDVAAYIYFYGHLPSNYMTKNEARKKGWQTVSYDIWELEDCYGMSIGGDRFGNYEGLLPEGMEYYECDIDYEGGNRNAKRLVFSYDGYIYYTEDHYESFEELYGGY